MTSGVHNVTVWSQVGGHRVRRAAAVVPLAGERGLVVGARRGRIAGFLLVAPDAAGQVAIDGIAVDAGMHALRRGQRIDHPGEILWVARDAAPEERTYDPAHDGAEQRCLRTKVRLTPGEAIVVCPGTVATPCGGLYRRSAWTAGYRCHACGFDPAARPWQPPVVGTGADLARLLALAEGADDARA